LIKRKENNVTGKKEKGEGGSKECKRKYVTKEPETQVRRDYWVTEKDGHRLWADRDKVGQRL
jgi:hypothetical protein